MAQNSSNLLSVPGLLLYSYYPPPCITNWGLEKNGVKYHCAAAGVFLLIDIVSADRVNVYLFVLYND